MVVPAPRARNDSCAATSWLGVAEESAAEIGFQDVADHGCGLGGARLSSLEGGQGEDGRFAAVGIGDEEDVVRADPDVFGGAGLAGGVDARAGPSADRSAS